MLRNGATVAATDASHLQLAQALAQAGLVRLVARRFIRCAYPDDEDYLEVPDRGCEARIDPDRCPTDCPECGRTIDYPGVAKTIFSETAVELDCKGIAVFLGVTLAACGGVVAPADGAGFAWRVTLEGAEPAVVFLADALGSNWRSPGEGGRSPHVAITACQAAPPHDSATVVALADWLTRDAGWRAASVRRAAGPAPVTHRGGAAPVPAGDARSVLPAPGTQIDIRIDAGTTAGYPVEFNLGGVRHFQGHAPAELPALPRGGGRCLYTWLCGDPMLAAAWQAASEAAPPLHIRLRIEAPELQRLPWEALQAPLDGAWLDVAAASLTPFARYLAHSGRPRRAISQRPARVLVAVAAPGDLAENGMAVIDRAGEWRCLEQGLAQASAAEFLAEPCTLAAVERHLREGYHCLHLVAHGASGEDGPYLILEDESGRLAPVAGDTFADMVNRLAAGGATALRLVFLDACHSAAAGGMGNLAAALICAGVPAVVAMQSAIDTTSSRRFALEFYRQLFQHGLVDLAANQARATLLTLGLPGSAVPALYLRLPDGRLFYPPAEAAGGEETPAGFRPAATTLQPA